jgi:hypothetical protein
MGRFETIFPTGGAVAFQYYYDPASNETTRYNWLNGVTQKYTRDALNRMSRLDLQNATGTISYENYGYDPMSRLTSVSRKDGTSDVFGYYLDGELKTAQFYGTPGSSSTSTEVPPDCFDCPPPEGERRERRGQIRVALI